MQGHGMKFIGNSVPKLIKKQSDGKLDVVYDSYEWGEEHSDVFDTVMFATGKNIFTYYPILRPPLQRYPL